MANTYTQLNVMLVYAVEERASIITPSLAERLYPYLGGILNTFDCFPLKIGGHRDHVHLFFEWNPDRSLSEIARETKRVSSGWINENRWIDGRFRWQTGYSAFSYSRSQRNDVITYIENQEKHHSRVTFIEEYIDLLKKFGIKFEERFIFHPVE